MSKWIVAAAIVGLLCLPVSALVSLQPGVNEMKFNDVSGNWNGNATTSTPLAVGVAPSGGSELRSLFNLTGLFTPPTASLPYWSPTVSEQITGVLYDLVLTSATGLTSDGKIQAGTELYYSPGTRNEFTAANDAKSQSISGFGGVWGGVIQLYDNTTPTITDLAATTPSTWTAKTGGALANPDQFAGITQGTLWLSGVLLELNKLGAFGDPGAPNGAVYELLFATATEARGTGFINVFGGTAAGAIVPSTYGPYIDATLSNTIDLTQTGNWQATSFDPILTDVTSIPEPTIMLLFGASIVGGLLRRRF